MMGLSVLGASIFSISDSMYSDGFNVLIKNLKGLSTLEPNMVNYQTLIGHLG